MTTWNVTTNKTASSWSDASKTSSSWSIADYETGAAYTYNQPLMTYNQAIFSSRAVLYNSLSTPTSWSYANKS